MSPLEMLAELCARHGHAAWAETLRSLAAREDLRAETFWADVGDGSLWGSAPDSLATLRLGDGQAPEADQRAFAAALLALADDLELRGVASEAARVWLGQQRPS